MTVGVVLNNGAAHRLRPVAEAGEFYYFRHASGAIVKLLKWRFRDLAVSLKDLKAPAAPPEVSTDEEDWASPPPGFGSGSPEEPENGRHEH